ncbi:MAG TPA: acyl-CoA dehydrogenase family protein [Spirochaetota bacterium]|nr:acyl-CoA dehydrogenase family protein [Spirochaetota bacterium]HPI89282.1 acyl-CoA dehydrogenase family protein [Spirochaetota bacterium]HPR48558.1 acyl-CoA dehydrogenase family protein [Spirochaetota bacterium]
MAYDVSELFPYPRNWVDDDTRAIAAAIHKWADNEIINNRLEYQKAYARLFNERRRSHNLDIGFQRIIFPEEYGGSGFNSLQKTPALVTILGELSRADAGMGFMSALEYSLSAVAAMEPNVNNKICDLIAPLLCGTELKTVSILMPGPGTAGRDDPLFMGRSISARIEPHRGGYLLNGSGIRPVGNGAIADIFGVVCANPEGKAGIALITADRSGIVRGESIRQTGLDACLNADISFNNTPVPSEHVVMNDDAVRELYTWLNLFLGAVSVGACLNFFEILRNWAENRTIKGKGLLKNNPLCASVLATVAEEIGLAKILVYNISNFLGRTEVWGGHENPVIFMAAQMFGKRIQQSALNAINRGMELMASAGYAKEWHAEKHWRDVKTIQSVLCGVASEVPVHMDMARFFYDSAVVA